MRHSLSTGVRRRRRCGTANLQAFGAGELNVVGILYPPDMVGPCTLPAAVCLEYSGYQNAVWNPQQPKVAPVQSVLPTIIEWMEGARRATACTAAEQVPLRLALPVIIHKCRYWTQSAVCVDIVPRSLPSTSSHSWR